MKNNITELVFILDRSGSMAGLESDTIGMVENQPHHFVPRWREAINFIAGCDEVALKNATS